MGHHVSSSRARSKEQAQVEHRHNHKVVQVEEREPVEDRGGYFHAHTEVGCRDPEASHTVDSRVVALMVAVVHIDRTQAAVGAIYQHRNY